jgi:CheY-like chemotaxis protein
MGETFTVGLSSDIVFGIKDEFFSECNGSMTDTEVHTFITKKALKKNWNKLLILFDSAHTSTALRIALHIRLTKEFGERKFCPIVLASNVSLESVLRLGKEYASILLSEGIKFLSNPSEEDISLEISNLVGISNQEYHGDFLQKIILHNAGGRHSMANLWGARILDEVANTNALTTHYSSNELISSLYYKYTSAKNVTNINSDDTSFSRVNAKGKKIILIDDEAEKGWERVLRSIFKLDKKEDFVIVNQKVNNYDEFSSDNKRQIESGVFDIYLVDLRLNGEKEDESQNPSHFSGLTVVRKIKEMNKGNQVIIFTASNKAWSYKTMLEEGASGYYVKESPELALPFGLSIAAYKDFIATCEFCLNESFLRIVADNIKFIKQAVNEGEWKLPYGFYDNQQESWPENHLKMISEELDIFFDLLASRNKSRLNHAMIMMVKVLEELNRIYFSFEKNCYTVFRDGRELGYTDYEHRWVEFDQPKDNLKHEIVNSSKNLVHNILKRSKYSSKPLYSIIEELFGRRNNYIHPKDSMINVSQKDIMNWSNGLKELFSHIKKYPFSS